MKPAKRFNLFSLIISLLAFLLLVVILFWGLMGNGFFASTNLEIDPSTAEHYEYTWAPDSLRSLDIDWVSGEVSVIPGSRDEVVITEYAGRALKDGEKLKLTASGSTLKIEWRRSKNLLSLFRSSSAKHLVVEVPQSLLDRLQDLHCEGTSADLLIQDLTCAALDLETISGGIRCEGLTAETADLEVTSGSVFLAGCDFQGIDLSTVSGSSELVDITAATICYSGVSGDLRFQGSLSKTWKAESVSGHLTAITTAAPDTLNLETVSGDIAVTFPEPSGFTASFESVSGSFDCAFPVTGLSGKSGNAAFGDGSRDYQFATISGDIELLRSDG